MNSESNHWKLGAFAIAVVSVAIGALIWLGATRFSRETYYAVSFINETVQGLDVGAPVKYRGVTIGTVDTITIAPDRTHVQIQSEIFLDAMMRLGLRSTKPDPESGEPFIPPEVRVRLANAGITGLKFLDVDLYDPAVTPLQDLTFETPWNYVPSVPSTLKNIEDSVVALLDELPVLMTDARELLQNLNSTVDELQVGELSAQASDLLAKIDERVAAIDPVMTQRTAEDMSALIAETRTLVEKVNREDGPFFNLVRRLDSVAATFDDLGQNANREMQGMALADTTASLRRSSDSMGDLAVDARGLARDFQEDLLVLREALESMRALMAMLERDPSSLIHGKSQTSD